nr:uncharacterized mitochondrial protein AtMg00810-like [Tanacetum cinerariifolium]
MIEGLMYQTASRPDIAFSTFVYARYQARPMVKHLKEVKRIFRYLRQSYNMGLWYPKDYGFELIAYSDEDYAEFIMAQPRQQRDFPQDQLCPPNKLFDLMDANKKFDMEDGSKYKLNFLLGTKELTITVADFKRMFQLPQATDNNNARFVAAPNFRQMVPLFLKDLGLSLKLKSPSKFEGLHYSLMHPTTLIPYPRFTKMIIDHYMTEHHDISIRVHDNYHKVENDDLVKNTFKSRKNKEGTGMNIPDWMLTKEMKQIFHYQITTSAPKTPNTEVTKGESSAQRKSIVIRLRVPPRRQDLETPIPTAVGIDVTNLVEIIQIEPKSDKKSPKAEKGVDIVTITNDDEEEESVRDEFELRRLEKGKELMVTNPTPSSSTPLSSSPKPKTGGFRRCKSFIHQMGGCYGLLFGHRTKTFMLKKNFNQLFAMLYEALKEMLPLMVNKEVNKIAKMTVPIYVAEGLLMERQKTQADVAAMIVEAIQKERGNLRVEVISQLVDLLPFAQEIITIIKMMMLILRRRIMKKARKHLREINEAQLQKVVDAMVRQKCNSGEEHQYHVDQMQNYLKSVIVWESRKERLSLLTLKKKAPLVHRQKKYILSLHKFHVAPFLDDDMKERTSRWVNKHIKKFNPYARFSVEHWKYMWAKQFHIKRQKEQRENLERLYSDSKIVEVIRTSYEQEQDYRYLNKNDIKDLYMLCINGKVDDYKETGLLGSLIVFIRATVIWERVYDFQLGMESYQQKVNLTAPTITFPGIEEYERFTITFEPVIEKLKKYNKDVKYGYANPNPSEADAEYLRIYEEDI